MRHSPHHAETDPAVVRRLIAENPWATLVSQADGLVASHYPILLDEESDDLAIYTHVGRPDDGFHGFGSGAEVLLIVAGPHGYISPSWYAPGATQAPTWNFSVAHCYGVPELLEPERNLAVLTRLVAHFERHVEEPLYLDQEYGARVARGTVGLRLAITRFVCKVKMSDDKDPVTQRQVLAQLRGDGPYASPALADDMERALAAGDFDYDAGGAGYSRLRRADPRIEARVHAALGAARSVLNVGAGAGSYEPEDRYVVAVEPAAAMRAQRTAPAVIGVAEALPFDDDSFDAVMAMATIHQWPDLDGGLRELRRVARGPVVILTWDPAAIQDFWLDEYVPELLASERARLPDVARVATALGGDLAVTAPPIPHDCVDGFIECYYARPEDLLRPEVRAAQSAWAFADPGAVERGVARLRAALASGAWDARHGHLRTQPEYEGALRLIVSRP